MDQSNIREAFNSLTTAIKQEDWELVHEVRDFLSEFLDENRKDVDDLDSTDDL